MVVDQIDICDVRALKFEHQPPIARNPNRPLSCSLALHRVEPETGIVQIGGRSRRRARSAEREAMPRVGIDSPRVPRGEKSLQALVAYARDHTPPVTYRLSDLQPFRPAWSIKIASIGRCEWLGRLSDLAAVGASSPFRDSIACAIYVKGGAEQPGSLDERIDRRALACFCRAGGQRGSLRFGK